jgi:hypothetical protein
MAMSDRICEEHRCIAVAVTPRSVKRRSTNFDLDFEFVVCQHHADQLDEGARVEVYYEAGQPRAALVIHPVGQ